MKIIIAGDGDVGYYLAKLLEPEFKDITLIDTQKDKLDFVEETLGIATVYGDATSYKVLKEAEVEKADLLIAVTSNESSNISTCVIGKKMGARFTIARIDNMEYLMDKNTLDMKELGIDDLISPESLAAREVKYILKSPALTEVFNFHARELYMMGLTLEEGAPIVGKSVAEVAHLVPNNSFMVVAAYRNGQTIIPNGNFKYLKGDHLYFVSTDDGKNKVLDYAGKKNGVIKNLLIIGGSRTGKYIALRLSKYYNIKLIEKNFDRCQYLAELIPKVQIVHGDATNIDLLKEEGLEFGY